MIGCFGAGRVYGKFSLLHDFAGSADTWLRYEGLENSYREDMGDTWCEAGFGVNLRLTDSTYVYADVSRPSAATWRRLGSGTRACGGASDSVHVHKKRAAFEAAFLYVHARADASRSFSRKNFVFAVRSGPSVWSAPPTRKTAFGPYTRRISGKSCHFMPPLGTGKAVFT